MIRGDISVKFLISVGAMIYVFWELYEVVNTFMEERWVWPRLGKAGYLLFVLVVIVHMFLFVTILSYWGSLAGLW